MSISTITIGSQTITLVQLPAAPGLKQVDWKYADQVASVRSAFTGQTQRQKWPGADLLAGSAEMPPLTAAQADDWEAFLMQLRGMANAFQMGDPLRPTPRGSGLTWPNAPIVDNTVSGGNAAGSETLGTKGWVPNAQGVLLRGDWIQAGYRMYRVLDPVNADSSGKATINIWPSLRETPTNNGSSAGFVNASGATAMTNSYPLEETEFNGIIWSNFSTPVLPADAVIQGIYPVLICSAVHSVVYSYFAFGTGLTFSSGGSLFTSPFNPDNTGFASTELWAASIGTSLSALTGQGIKVNFDATVMGSGYPDTITVTGVGFAIYYTSATPVTDPQMPPPFTVPGGQGLAWSLPFTESDTGATDTGASSGVPATYNGGLTLNNPKGLFCLAANERGSSADITRLTKTNFSFQEYR